MFESIEPIFSPKSKRLNRGPGSAKHLLSLLKLAQVARRYFPIESSKDILELCLPNMNINHLSQTITSLSLMVLFLPTAQLKTEAVNTQVFSWVPVCFRLWSLLVNVPVIDALFLDLLSRLAEDQVAHPHISNLNQELVKWIATVGLRTLDLPVGSGSSGLENGTLRGRNANLTNGVSVTGRSADIAYSICRVRNYFYLSLKSFKFIRVE